MKKQSKKISGLKKLLLGTVVIGGILFGANQTREYIKSSYVPGFSQRIDSKSLSEAKDKFFSGIIEGLGESFNNLAYAIKESRENYNPFFDYPYINPFDEPYFESMSNDLMSFSRQVLTKIKPQQDLKDTVRKMNYPDFKNSVNQSQENYNPFFDYPYINPFDYSVESFKLISDSLIEFSRETH